ncbi:MAG: hypothetical protein JXB45_07080 [Candidatus Krumholzibacteriota bacterium]|nr:hypothetical protein [Candidatus Krumholzibacteriota bacterium]
MKCVIGSILTLALLSAALAGCNENPVLRPEEEPPILSQPYVFIDIPAPGASIPNYSKVVRFGWRSEGKNPTRDIRYLWTQSIDTLGQYNSSFDFIKDLNANPWRYGDRWSRWYTLTAPGDSGLCTIIGDDEELVVGRYHFFAVQSRDYRGAVTDTFTKNVNVRHFQVYSVTGPYLRVLDPLLASFRFVGTNLNPEVRKVAPGTPLNFHWAADLSAYSGTLAGYRYGWDIEDPDRWDAPYRPEITAIAQTMFFSGSHTLYIEASDLGGNLARGRITVEVVPFPLDRNLLWVDDFYATNAPNPTYSYPPEYEHDDFWIDICSRAEGFDPVRDVYDCFQYYSPPEIDHMGRYKNIIWTYSQGNNDYWSKIVHFIPESTILQGSSDVTSNLISIYLRRGGHIWTLGRSDADGGLASVLEASAMIFPLNLKCEITGPSGGCDGDRSGTSSMAYDNYCVTMIDKVSGRFRTDSGMPLRYVNHYDVMRYAYRDDADAMTGAHADIPPRLDLWEEVTAPGRFFNFDLTSVPGGFTYVEVYDPEYWMDRRLVASRTCFHPLYRMRSAAENSALDHSVIAIWVTSFEDVVPEVSSGAAVAAPSFHFGFPLWFFRRETADSLADFIFNQWGISGAGG